MNIDVAIFWHFQQSIRNNAAVGSNDDDVWRAFSEQRFDLWRADRFRLQKLQPVFFRIFGHRWCLQFFAAALWAVRLREHEIDLVSGSDQPVEDGHRKIRRAHVNDLHQSVTLSMAVALSVKMMPFK